MDPLTLVMLAVLALLVFFMFRNGRKRQKDTAALQAQMVTGADVMTNFGLYGTIVSINEEENKVALEIAPGTIVQIHRQTIARVVEPTVATDDELAETAVVDHSTPSLTKEPEYGQRTADDTIVTDTTVSDANVTDTNTEPKKGDA